MTTSACPLPKRLKAARERAGLSQKALGKLAGIDEFVASPRINQYERGVHAPGYEMASRLAKRLNIPTAYLYSDSDVEAEMLMLFHQLGERARKHILRSIQGVSSR